MLARPEARVTVEQMQPVWGTIIAAITELTDTQNNLMKAIIEVEQQLQEKSFFDRAKAIMKKAD